MVEKEKDLGEAFLKKYQKFLEENGFEYEDMQYTIDGKDLAVSFMKENADGNKTMEIIFFINKRSKKIVAKIITRDEDCVDNVRAKYQNIPFDTIMKMIKNGNIKFGELKKYLWDWFGDNPEYYQNEEDFWNDDECKEDEDE